MTDKEIIIDGVNVAGCNKRNWLEFATYNCFENGGCQCNDNPNCYYKQLKRKEQALEKIEEVVKTGISSSLCNCGLRAMSEDVLLIINEVKNDN